MIIFYIFDPAVTFGKEDIEMFGYKTHAQALEGYLGNKKFVKSTDKRGGDFAVKKQYGNRLWYIKI